MFFFGEIYRKREGLCKNYLYDVALGIERLKQDDFENQTSDGKLQGTDADLP